MPLRLLKQASSTALTTQLCCTLGLCRWVGEVQNALVLLLEVEGLRHSKLFVWSVTHFILPHSIRLVGAADRPLVLHYGRQFEVAGYIFGKEWFRLVAVVSAV